MPDMYSMVRMTHQATPHHRPTFTHFFASFDFFSASSILPTAKAELTEHALTIPTTPNGIQQKMVTKIECRSHVFGQISLFFSSILIILLAVTF